MLSMVAGEEEAEEPEYDAVMMGVMRASLRVVPLESSLRYLWFAPKVSRGGDVEGRPFYH